MFIVKPRTIVSPHTTDELKILFAPHQPGVYSAQVQVGASPVVADSETRVIQHTVPQMVVLTALAERPNVEVSANSNIAQKSTFSPKTVILLVLNSA